MIAECLILVALLDVAFLRSFLLQLLRGGFLIRVALREPGVHVQLLSGREDSLLSAEQRQRNGSVSCLGAGGFDEVDGRVSDEVRDEGVCRRIVDLQRLLILLQDTVVDEADLGGQGHSLHLVMGDVDEGRSGLHVQTLQLVAHFQTELRVQVGQRLVHEEDGGFRSQGAGDGDTLLLSAGKLCRITVHEHADLDDAGDAAHCQVDLFFGELPLFLHDLAVLHELVAVVQTLGGLRIGRFLLQGSCLGGDVLSGLQMIGEELLRGGHGDREGIDQLDQAALLIDLSVLVPAVLDDLFHFLGLLQDLRQLGGGAGFKVHLRELFFHIVKTEGDVLLHGHVRPQRVVLEKEADFSLVGGDVDSHVAVKDDAVADGDLSGGRGLEACDHAEDGGLTAAGGSQQRDEGIVRDVHADIVGSVEFAPAFGDVFQFDFRHD